jgi:hypothetical protein
VHPVKIGNSNFLALFVEKRTKETNSAPVNRLELLSTLALVHVALAQVLLQERGARQADKKLQTSDYPEESRVEKDTQED